MIRIIRNFITEEATLEITQYLTTVDSEVTIETPADEKKFHQWRKLVSSDENYFAPNADNLKILNKEIPLIPELIYKELVNQFGYFSELNIENDYFFILKYNIGGGIKPHTDGEYNVEYAFITLLNDDFEGGQFYLKGELFDLKKGDALIIGGNVIHEVKPVTKGTRYSLVARFKMVD